MAYDRFLIAPLNSGLQTNLKPFLIQDDAWANLRNAYQFRGRVRKRFGSYGTGEIGTSTTPYTFLSRLAIQIGVTTSGALTVMVPGSLYLPGMQFTVGSQVFTVISSLANPRDMFATGPGTGTFSVSGTDVGMVAITGTGVANNTPVYFYPTQPVMGLAQYEQGVIYDQPTFAYDTQFAYTFTGGAWLRSGVAQWHPVNGADSNFFWTGNWQGITADLRAMFVTNFQAAIGLGLLTDDPIWDYDSVSNPTWQPFSYEPDAAINPTNTQPYTVTQTVPGTPTIIANFVQTCRIILPFKGRLLLLNTIENNAEGADEFDPDDPTTSGITPTTYATSTNTAFPQRCRFSHNGSPFALNAWLEPNQIYNPAGSGDLYADGGGFIDAATDEQIISAEFIKDRLIVFFERSTWEIAYTGNEVEPFVFQKINTELGSEATFASVPFDKDILTIGTTGVHACNAANVSRVDDAIPDEIFDINIMNNGLDRIAGIRDYKPEMVYWTYTANDQNINNVFPNKVLVYNYKTGTWGINDDTLTCFGYCEQQTGVTWASSFPRTWAEATVPWDDGLQAADFRQVIAGNQQGYIMNIDVDTTRNSPALAIANIVTNVSGGLTLTIYNHNLQTNTAEDTLTTGQFILIENLPTGMTITDQFGNIQTIFQIENVVDVNTVQVGINLPIELILTFNGGPYTAGATAARVSTIGALSKQWNPYLKEATNFTLGFIDFAVSKQSMFDPSGAPGPQVTVDYFPSSSTFSILNNQASPGTLSCNGVLELTPYNPTYAPMEENQTLLWHPIYFSIDGEFVQIYIYYSPAQMILPAVSLSDFDLNALVLHTQKTSQRLQ